MPCSCAHVAAFGVSHGMAAKTKTKKPGGLMYRMFVASVKPTNAVRLVASHRKRDSTTPPETPSKLPSLLYKFCSRTRSNRIDRLIDLSSLTGCVGGIARHGAACGGHRRCRWPPNSCPHKSRNLTCHIQCKQSNIQTSNGTQHPIRTRETGGQLA